MAAALVGGAFLSSFLNVLFDRLSSPEVANWIKGKKLDKKLLRRLRTTLNVVRAVLNDAEQKQITDPNVKEWLAFLEDAVYKADDLMDEVSTKAATQKDPGNIWTRYFNSQDRKMISEIEEVIDTLEDIVRHKDELGLKEIANLNMSQRTQSTNLVEKSEIYGRDKDKDAIIKLLLDDTSDARISVISVVGMGGLGKTTLAQLVYNDDKLKGNFDYTAWVCVSEQFNIVDITKTITMAETGKTCDHNDLNLLQNDLKEKLSGKKFLIVLDDIWNDCSEEWRTLKKPLQYGNKGSKILVTTRSNKVASVMENSTIHKLNLLPEKDCWTMFVKHAFLSSESREYSTLEEIGKKIVSKCKGLPLAVETLGSLLRSNHEVNYWDNILKNEIWNLPEDERRIIPALRISYHHLPSHLKRCFVYCSLFSQDHKFDKDKLILLWMAEDFLRPMGTMTLEEIGSVYFDELVARSFFQPDGTMFGGRVFVMHDLMHDLATLFAGEFYFTYEKLGTGISDKTRHLSCNGHCLDPQLLTAPQCQGIRTFVVNNLQPSSMTLISQLKCVRVLSLQWPSGIYWLLPDSIGDLIHLRYLDLSGAYIVTLPESLSKLYNLQTLKLYRCRRLKMLPSGMQDLVNLRYLDISNADIVTLPESLGKLYNLQTLKLRCCRRLKMLPSGMQDLVNLRHLDIRETCLEEMPKAMSKLKHLQFLRYYIVGKHEENKIRELGPLATLHGSLDISNLENVGDSDEASKARINDKKYINSLVLSWSSNSSFDDSRKEREILDKLQPHPNLKELSIDGYRGATLSDWLGDSSYKNMTNLNLKGCKNCCMLPSLGELSSLKHLEISHFDMLPSISAEFYKGRESCSKISFQSLETLKFSHLYGWEIWHSFEFGSTFPQLKELTIRGCPVLELKQLTTWIIGDLPNHLPVLEKLTIDDQCNELKCWERACPLPMTNERLELTIKSENKQRMQELPRSLPSLEIEGNRLVESVLEAMTHTQPTYLRQLHISSCDSVLSFPGDCLPSSLQELEIWSCSNLDILMQQHDSLRKLVIVWTCHSLTSFPLNAFPNLTYLHICGCKNLKSLVVVSQSDDTAISSLRSLTIEECPKFVSFSTLWMAVPQLESLHISGCPEIDSFPEGGLPPNLRQLSIRSCEKLESFLASMDLRSHGLTRLKIGIKEKSVKSFPKEGLGWLPTSLESLILAGSGSNWEELETLDCNGLSHLTSLQSLEIEHCYKLKNMTGERLPASLTRLHILGCYSLRERLKDPQIWSKISHIPNIEVDWKQI